MVTLARLALALLAATAIAGGTPAPGPLSPPAQAASLSPAAQSHSPAADTRDLPLLPERPKPPKLDQSVAWEYVTVVTLISAPFTSLASVVLAAVVEGIAQGHFPPNFSRPVLAATAGVAGATSLGIGLVSFNWGGSPPQAQTAGLSPTARALDAAGATVNAPSPAASPASQQPEPLRTPHP